MATLKELTGKDGGILIVDSYVICLFWGDYRDNDLPFISGDFIFPCHLKQPRLEESKHETVEHLQDVFPEMVSVFIDRRLLENKALDFSLDPNHPADVYTLTGASGMKLKIVVPKNWWNE